MLAIFKKTIKDNWLRVSLFTLIMLAFVLMFVAIFPSLKENAAEFQAIIGSYPDEFFQGFNVELENAFTSLEGYFSVENYSFIWPILMLAMTGGITISLFVKEQDEKTLLTLLTQPLSRLEVFLQKILAGFLLVEAFVFVTVFSVVPFALLLDVDYEFEPHAKMFLAGSALALAIFAFGVFTSTVFNRRSIANGVFAGGLIISYAFNVFGNLEEDLEILQDLSIFNYFEYNAILVDNELALEPLLILAVPAIAILVFCYVWFSRKDYDL